MARGTIPKEPKRPPQLTMPRDEARDKIMSRHTLGQSLLERQKGSIGNQQQLDDAEAEARKWSIFNVDLLRRLFDQPEYADAYSEAGRSMIMMLERDLGRDIRDHLEWLTAKLRNLESLSERIDLFDVVPIVAAQAAANPLAAEALLSASKREVFIVHGRDNEAKSVVARFIEQCGLKAIILHEEADEGRTVIEKFEQTSNVAFAIVLLTPDDVGGLAPIDSDTRGLAPRARQNVILELGYFLGKLGRKGVCALRKGEVEIPSDFAGVIYTPLDAAEGWKITLARELSRAGLEIDPAKAFGL
jgi:predicted nucleotide-binding protein